MNRCLLQSDTFCALTLPGMDFTVVLWPMGFRSVQTLTFAAPGLGHAEGGLGHFPGDPEEQLRGAFRNIASTLTEAGASWSDVVEINSYHVGLRGHADFLLSVAAEFLQAPYLAWTPVGVTELWPPEAVVEIRCVAIVAKSRPLDRCSCPGPGAPRCPTNPADRGTLNNWRVNQVTTAYGPTVAR